MEKKLAVGERYAWIDVAKGYGILFVMWAHLINEGLNRWIYSFHMPLFFFLSGHVFHTRYPFGEFVKRKAKTLLVPYFCLGIPMVLFEWLRYSVWRNGGKSLFQLAGDLLIQKRFQTLWYLACLFFLNLFFYGMAKKVKNEWYLLAISFVLTVVGLIYYKLGGRELPWNVDTCLTAMPFFAGGYWYKHHSEEIRLRIGKRGGIVFLLSLIGNIGCCVLTWHLAGEGLEMFYNQYGSPVFTYISAFFGIVCVVMLAKRWTITWLRQLGENSMLYYAWHQAIMMPIVEHILWRLGWYVTHANSVIELVLYKLVSIALILLLTAICDKLIKKMRLQFILGKA